jgi:hypothetical protein
MAEIDDQKKTQIVNECNALRAQSQDETTICKVLSAKYSIDKATLDEIMEEAREAQQTQGQKGPLKGPANPAEGDQLGRAPPKGTVQSGKEPKTD